MNHLTLKFVNDGCKAELFETIFRSTLAGRTLRCIRGRHAFPANIDGTFLWSAAIKSMCAIFLKAKLFGPTLGSKSEYSNIPGISSDFSDWASSFDFAISKRPHWLLDMFGLDSVGNPLIKRLFIRQNTERKRPGPVSILLNTSFLSAENIDIFVNDEPIGHESLILLLRAIGYLESSSSANQHGVVPQKFSSRSSLTQQSGMGVTLELKKNSILLPFLDHFVLSLSDYGVSRRRDFLIERECSVALKLALLLFDTVYIPAVSYVQSPLCRRLLDEHISFAHVGAIRLLSDASTWREFFLIRRGEYQRKSRERALYSDRKVASRIEEFPIFATEVETTRALHHEWQRIAHSRSIHSKFFAVDNIVRHSAHERSDLIASAAEDLGPYAFIGKNLGGALKKRGMNIAESTLTALICDLFFSHFCSSAKIPVLDDLAFVRGLGIATSKHSYSFCKMIRLLREYHPQYFQRIANGKALSPALERSMLKASPFFSASVMKAGEDVVH